MSFKPFTEKIKKKKIGIPEPDPDPDPSSRKRIRNTEDIPQVKMFNPNLYKNKSYDMNFIRKNMSYMSL